MKTFSNNLKNIYMNYNDVLFNKQKQDKLIWIITNNA